MTASPHIVIACAYVLHDAGEQVLFIGGLPTLAIACYEAVQGAPASIVHSYTDYVNRVVCKKY